MVHRDHPHLPLIVCGASVMALVAGYVNAFAIVEGGSVSGVTGLTTRAGIAFTFNRDAVRGVLLVAQVVCFLSGSFTGGYLAPSRRMRMEVPYGVAVLIESLFLAAGTVLLYFDLVVESKFPLAFAMGLQNGLATYYSNAVIRLTHITGMVSDVGMLLGEAVRRREITADLWKLKVYLPIIGSFFCGALIGGLFAHQPFFMLVPTLLCFLMGLSYITGRVVFVQHALYKARLERFSPLQIIFPPPPPEEPEDVELASEDFPDAPLQIMGHNLKRAQSERVDRQMDGQSVTDPDELDMQFDLHSIPIDVSQMEEAHLPPRFDLPRRGVSTVVVSEDKWTKARRIQSMPFL